MWNLFVYHHELYPTRLHLEKDGDRELTHGESIVASTPGGIYRDLLRIIEADPHVVFGGRISLSGWEKARVAGRALAGRAV